MAIALNSKQNISFSGLKQNIEQSRQIVASVRKEIGRPNSGSYIEIRRMQHSGDLRYLDICNRLKPIQDKYSKQIEEERGFINGWETFMKFGYKFLKCLPFVKESPSMDIHKYIQQMKKSILKSNNANCGEMADLVQYEHLTRGIKTHNVGLKFYDKAEPFYEANYLRDHCFLVRGLAKNAELSEPHTWGQNAVIVDSWIGTGIVEKAFDTPIPTYKNGQKVRGEFIQGGISKILDFFKFNPDTEKSRFFDDNLSYSREFIENMQAKGK